MARATIAGCLVLALISSAGCDSPFPPETLVERLRILAIQADPPEVTPLDEVDLRALVVDPTGDGRPLVYTWAVCLVEIGATASDLACPGPDSYLIPADGAQAMLSMPELVAWLAEQGWPIDSPQGGDPAELPDELPMLIGLRLEAPDGEVIRAVKRVEVLLVEPGPDLNHNPKLAGWTLDSQALEPGPLTVKAGDEVLLEPLLSEDSQEFFTPAGETEERLEDHLFSWFGTAGEFLDRRTILDVDSDGERLDWNWWTAPEEPGLVDLWLVVRDGRYGVDWRAARVEVQPAAAE